MDNIFIKQLTFCGIHGLTEKEKFISQPFAIDIIMEVEDSLTSLASHTDSIDHTIDYRLPKKVAQEIIEGPSCLLIEKIAEQIALKIIEQQPMIESVSVTVQKTNIWNNGIPGVTIKRYRKSTV